MPKLARYGAGTRQVRRFQFLFWTTNRFHVAVLLFRSQRTSKYGKNISDTLTCGSCATFFVLFTFWRHLLSITEQTHGNMECETRVDKGYPSWWNCKRVSDWSAWMSLRRVFTWHRGDFRADASSLRFPLMAQEPAWLYICLHDTTTKFHAGASHHGASSPAQLY